MQTRSWTALLLISAALLCAAQSVVAQEDERDEFDIQLDAVWETLEQDLDQARDELEALRTDVMASDDLENQGDWYYTLAFIERQSGQLDAANDMIEKSIVAYTEAEREEDRLGATMFKAELAAAQNGYPQAIEIYEDMLQQAEQIESVDMQVLALQGIGDAYTVLGNYDSGLENLLYAYELSANSSDPSYKQGTLILLGNLYAEIDASEKAIEMYQDALEYEIESENELGQAIERYNIGRAYADMEEYEQALEEYELALPLSEKAGIPMTTGFVYYGMGLAQLGLGDQSAARSAFGRALDIFESIDERLQAAKTKRYLAEVEANAGNFDASRSLLSEAEAIFRENQADKDLAEALRLQAANLARLDDYALAYQKTLESAKITDRLASEERARRTAALRVQFESERAEERNRNLEAENASNTALIERQKRYNMLISGGIFALMLVAIALSYSIWRQKKLEHQLVMLANSDELTGIANRRRLFELGEAEVMRASRYDQPLAVLALDLDFFKSINDRFGHATGDQVLIEVARHLQSQLRETDVLGRIGGEEFVVILPHTDRGRAEDVAQRLVRSVADLQSESLGQEYRLTLSAGVAWLQAKGDDFQLMLNRADAALYYAKAQGRNQVRLQSERGLAADNGFT